MTNEKRNACPICESHACNGLHYGYGDFYPEGGE